MADALPDPEGGYRLLRPEEKLADGDEFYGPPRGDIPAFWTLSANAEYNGGKQSPGLVYRREIAKEEASEDPDSAALVEELARECTCSGDRPCDGLLAGGFCDNLNLIGEEEEA